LLTPAQIAAGTKGYQCIGRTYYVNTPGKVKGFEAEIEGRPVQHLTLSAEVGYTNFNSPDLNVAGRANNRLLGVPDWSASAGAQYEWPVQWLRGTIVPRLDWFFQGTIDYSAVRTAYNEPSYSTVNARISYNRDDNLTVSVGATNLFDRFYWVNFFVYQDIGYPNVNAQPSPPRMLFATVSKRF
jgi:iron complex outermembrane receptor protein